VNYLQKYYMTFIPNSAGALYQAIPGTNQIDPKKINEQWLLNSLPIKYPQHWLLSRSVPKVLSEPVAQQFSLTGYANTALKTEIPIIQHAAELLIDDLAKLDNDIERYNRVSGVYPVYKVLEQDVTAQSILM